MKILDHSMINKKKPWETGGVKWREVRLGDKKIAKIILGQSPPSSSYNKEGYGIPFLQGNKEFGKFYPKNIMFTTNPKKKAQKGDILLSVRAAVGEVNIANKEYCIGRGLAAIKFNGEPKYLFYLLIHKKEELEELGRRGTTFKAITKEHIRNLKIIVPFRNGKQDLEAQKRIVEYIEANFSRIDKIIEKKKEALKQLDELWESVLEQTFKPKEGEEWREVRFNELLSKEKYQVGKVKVRNGLTDSGKIPVVDQGQELIRGYLNNEEIKYRGPLPLIIFGDHTKVIKFIDFPFIVGADGVKILIPNKDLVYPKYFYWLLRTVKLPEKGYSRHFKFLKQALYLIPFRNNQPDLEKQKEIANYLDNVYEKIKALEKKIQNQITQLEEIKKSILDEVFNYAGTG